MLRGVAKDALEAAVRGGVVLGCSGGLDSMVLLDLLAQLQKKSGGHVTVAHVNYGLRRSAVADERCVRKIAALHDLPCVVHACRGRVPARANLQNWAREVRYKFFTRVAKKVGAATMVVAHHADDQAETIVWHLLRGSGLAGLCGMSAVRAMNVSGGVQLFRPLLAVPRSALAEYARVRNIVFRNDPTNASPRFTRNRVRHELLPLCEALHAGAIRHIAALGNRVAHDEAYLTSTAQTSFDALRAAAARGAVQWRRKDFVEFPAAIRVRIFQLAYAALLGSMHHLAADHLEQMDHIATGHGGQYCLPGPAIFSCTATHCCINKGSLHRSSVSTKGSPL